MRGFLKTIIDHIGFQTSVLVVLALGGYQGIQVRTIILDIPGLLIQIVTVEAIPAAITFSALVFLSGILLTLEITRANPLAETRSTGPRITGIIPAYRASTILHESVESLTTSEYSNLDIAIVVEPGDTKTIQAAREYADQSNIRVLENRYTGSKAGAINDAVERLDTTYFAVLDADERAHPMFISRAIHHLTDNNTDVFQARRVPRVTGTVEAIAYCERILFHSAYKLMEPLGFTYCRSSSVAFTRDAFETVNGFDDLVTEDIDFAHKCYRAGLTVKQERDLTTEMEAPHTLRDFWGQRKRWQFGQIELFLKSIRRNYNQGGVRGVISTARLTSSLFASIFLIALTAKMIVLLVLGFETIVFLPLFVIALVILPVLLVDYRKGHIKTLSPGFIAAPIIYPALGILTTRCAFEYATRWDGSWYHVKKIGG